MSHKSLATTVNTFWEAFFHFSKDSTVDALFETSIEQSRFRCLIGFTALDASLSFYWKQEVLRDWAETLTLLNITLEDRQALDSILACFQGHLGRAQMIASLRFVAQTGEPETFSPTFVDVAIVLFVRSHPQFRSVELIEFLKSLCRLQKIRNACFHTGRNFDEVGARWALQLLERFESEAQAFSPCLATHLESAAPPLRRAA